MLHTMVLEATPGESVSPARYRWMAWLRAAIDESGFALAALDRGLRQHGVAVGRQGIREWLHGERSVSADSAFWVGETLHASLPRAAALVALYHAGFDEDVFGLLSCLSFVDRSVAGLLVAALPVTALPVDSDPDDYFVETKIGAATRFCGDFPEREALWKAWQSWRRRSSLRALPHELQAAIALVRSPEIDPDAARAAAWALARGWAKPGIKDEARADFVCWSHLPGYVSYLLDDSDDDDDDLIDGDALEQQARRDDFDRRPEEAS